MKAQPSTSYSKLVERTTHGSKSGYLACPEKNCYPTFVPLTVLCSYRYTLRLSLINTSGFLFPKGATSGILQATAPQFNGATSVTLDSAPGGIGAWSAAIPGGTNATGCFMNGEKLISSVLTI
jgi:hypothetical protein